MEKSCRLRPYYIHQDIRRTIRENKYFFLVTVLTAVLAVAFGIYLGVNADPRDEINGVISLILRGEYAPFSILWKYFLRFLVYACVLYIGGIFLSAPLFGSLSVFFFAKYQAQISTILFRTDALVGAVLSILLVCLPLLIVGTMILFLLTVYLSEFPAPYKGACLRKTIADSILVFLVSIALYFLSLVLILFVLCGILHVLFVSV